VHARNAATERRIATQKAQGGVGLANPASKAKAQQTLQATHGISNAFCLPKVDEYRRSHNPMKDPGMVTAIRESCLQSHGVNWHSKRPEVIAKATQTNMTKYGVTNASQQHYTDTTLQVLTDSHQLKELFTSCSVQDMAINLGVCETTVLKYLNIHGIRAPNQISAEVQITEWLSSMGFTDFEKTRKVLINKQELDMYSAIQNLAIEYCGLYWHSQAHKRRNYHANKYKQCEDQHIRLITIFEDEWLNSSSVVKNRLSQVLGINQKGPGARQLQVCEIDHKLAAQFLDSHHISGYTKASVCLGAHDSRNQLVAVMTFSQGRKFMKPKLDWQWEMVRFSTNGAHYAGVASKLFSHFVKHYQPTSVISYADLRWGQGTYLKNLGFTRFEDTPPNYWYFSLKNADFKRYHRFTFNKQALIRKYPELTTPLDTEYTIAKKAGLERIWDCGNAKWLWYNTNSK
jgi:hypothetical protein